MRYFAACCFTILSFPCFAQRVIDVSKENTQLGPNVFYAAGGEPFVNAKFVNLVEGTPYFKDEWLKGIVVDKAHHEYRNISIKLDLLDNKVHYLNDEEQELIATTPLEEVVLTDAAGNNYRFVRSSLFEKPVNGAKDSWYLWLCSGKASLYQIFSKTLSETKPYGSATSEQHMKTSEKYLILYNSSFSEVKKLKDVPAVLANKKTELEAFLKNSDDQKASMDDRFIKLIEYYNSLLKEQK